MRSRLPACDESSRLRIANGLSSVFRLGACTPPKCALRVMGIGRDKGDFLKELPKKMEISFTWSSQGGEYWKDFGLWSEAFHGNVGIWKDPRAVSRRPTHHRHSSSLGPLATGVNIMETTSSYG